MLKRRGLVPMKTGKADEIVLLRGLSSRRRAYLYEQLKQYAFRLVLRDILKRPEAFGPEELTRFCSRPKVMQYLDFLKRQGLISAPHGAYRMTRGSDRGFGDLLEWFVARLVEEEFLAEVIWGIRFKGILLGGDYDLIARMEETLIYSEVKSSPPKHIMLEEIQTFLDRIDGLLPHVALFFEDTQLRMKDKIVPLFEEALRSRHGRRSARQYPVVRLKGELFQINHQIYIVNSSRDIAANFRTCFRDYWRHRIRI